MTKKEEFRLGDVAVIVDCEHKTAPIVESSEYISVRTANISNGVIDFKNSNRVSSDTYKLWTKRMRPSEGDIVLAREAPVGEVGWIPRDRAVCLGQRTVLIRAEKSKLNSRYLLYYLANKDAKNELILRSTGSVVQHLNVKEIKDFIVNVHVDLAQQTAIASILSSLDDKIELNNQINQELEALAQALFKHWFIDFEFPISAAVAATMGKPNLEGKPYKSSGGEMVESELGEIPKGWRVGKVDEMFIVKGGTTPSTKETEYWDGEYYWTSPKDLSALQFPVLLTTEKRITTLGLKQIGSGLLPKGTLLLSSRAPIGYLAITEIETAINQGYIAINSKNELSNLFMLYWLKQNMSSVIERANGSTFLEISKTNFKEISLIIPQIDVHNLFNEQVSPMLNYLIETLKENQQLQSLRDSLLPRLISGELEVSEALTEKAI